MASTLNNPPSAGSPPQAIPVKSDQGRGLLRLVSGPQMIEDERAEAARKAEQEEEQVQDALASHIRSRMTDMRNFRNAEGISERLLNALRTYKGMYSQDKLGEIKQFGGSEVFARVTSTKCRAATALLRDVYLSTERPWDVDPTPVPKTPEDVDSAIEQLVNTEVQNNLMNGVQVDEQMISDRVTMLKKAAEQAHS